jgi:N-acetylmuramoyl-L-alanine amidase
VEAKDAGDAPLALGSSGERVRRLQEMLSRYGYGLDADGVFDERMRLVVVAFQRHFRQARFDGVVDGETQAILRTLTERLDAVA